MDTPAPQPPTTPPPSRPTSSFFPRTADAWLLFVAGIALIGYGAFTIAQALVSRQTFSLIGLIVLAVGAMLIPNRIIGLAAGVILLGAGIYMFIDNYNTLQSLLITVLGVMAIADHIRRARA